MDVTTSDLNAKIKEAYYWVLINLPHILKESFDEVVLVQQVGFYTAHQTQ